jgi:hypothetical protein
MKALQVEAAWTIANLSAGESSDTEYLVKIGVLPKLYKALRVNNEELHENVLKYFDYRRN